ncbi:isopentenyl-diphosphate Delta-isomerase [Naumannella halotolerans]|uniref:isopentenyl-diphosphate Delta-isomerase n=1 Tax=Naumannella halotolerans TaxID=993414 RepID=UPI0031334CA3
MRDLLLCALTPQSPPTSDPVVLVDEQGTRLGTAEKSLVHDSDTPLHLAFSTYLRAPDGRVLITRRALTKRTWPGVWTNSACGHLRPGETPAQAAERRVTEELGTAPLDLQTVLPDFAYRAVDAGGVVENELCPVLVGGIDPAGIDPDPSEVAEYDWVGWDDLRDCAARTPRLLSPWAVEQIVQLGPDPWGRS